MGNLFWSFLTNARVRAAGVVGAVVAERLLGKFGNLTQTLLFEHCGASMKQGNRLLPMLSVSAVGIAASCFWLSFPRSPLP